VAVIYTALFGTGYFVYGHPLPGLACAAGTAIAAWGLFRNLPRVGFK
jgi:hypothetical protein